MVGQREVSKKGNNTTQKRSSFTKQIENGGANEAEPHTSMGFKAHMTGDENFHVLNTKLAAQMANGFLGGSLRDSNKKRGPRRS